MALASSKETLKLPVSCVNPWVGLIGVISFFIALIAMKYFSLLGSIESLLFLYAAYAIPIVIIENVFLKNYKNPSNGLNFQHAGQINLGRVALKLLGMGGTLFLILFAYSLFSEYYGQLYFRFWSFLKTLAPYFFIGVIPYFVIIDRYMSKPDDGYVQAGRLFILDWSNIDWEALHQHFLGWGVKAFFIPLMFTTFSEDVIHFQSLDVSVLTTNFSTMYDFIRGNIFLIDILICSIGYLLTLRLFDSHIRSTEPTAFGWIIAIICYEPFWSFLSLYYLNYASSEINWEKWLQGSFWYPVWGSAILILLSIYAAATVIFGLRFSNLTHRGIITNGPYRWSKHPAYICKNLSYWLVAVPWISHQSFFEAIHNCTLLLLVNGIYYWRAKTEERHLSKDPVYVQYALAMNEHGLLAPFKRVLPFLKYTPP